MLDPGTAPFRCVWRHLSSLPLKIRSKLYIVFSASIITRNRKKELIHAHVYFLYIVMTLYDSDSPQNVGHQLINVSRRETTYFDESGKATYLKKRFVSIIIIIIATL